MSAWYLLTLPHDYKVSAQQHLQQSHFAASCEPTSKATFRLNPVFHTRICSGLSARFRVRHCRVDMLYLITYVIHDARACYPGYPCCLRGTNTVTAWSLPTHLRKNSISGRVVHARNHRLTKAKPTMHEIQIDRHEVSADPFPALFFQ